MTTDVTAVRTAGILSATLLSDRTRLKGLTVTATGVGGLQLRDGFGPGAPLKLWIDVADGVSNILIPGDGILFTTGVYAISTGAFTSASLFVG